MSWHLDDLDAVLEFDASDDLRQLVFALQAAPCFGGRGYELEDHELGGLGRQGSLGPDSSIRTVANTLSIGFEVRRWSQCSAGKSKKASSVLRKECCVRPVKNPWGAPLLRLSRSGTR